MRSGSAPHTIPRDLLTRLGEPDAELDGVRCWCLLAVARAIGCTRSAVANWLREGRIVHAVIERGRWYLTEDVIICLANLGIPAPGTYPPLVARPRGYPPLVAPRIYRDPQRPRDGRTPRQS